MEDTYRFWGQNVKGQGHSDMPYSGALSDCVSFLVCFAATDRQTHK